MNYFKAFVCLFYGLISVAQTLNSRFLFRTLQFNFYSVVFMVQRVFIVYVNYRMKKGTMLSREQLLYILPYSFIMCSINILSSYCVTVMPLAAFMAFKKFVVFFVLLVSLAMHLPINFSKVHYSCIGCIILGGLMIGEKDIFGGAFLGYVSSLVYTLFEALSLQYSLHLYEKGIYGPQDLMVANSILSLPYYLILIVWEQEPARIIDYLAIPTHPLLAPSLVLAILLSFASEYTANTISMKISPFEKASVSNIKDLVLTVVSIQYFQDFEMTSFSEVGIVFCLSASVVFSLTLMDGGPVDGPKALPYQNIGHDGGEELFGDSEKTGELEVE